MIIDTVKIMSKGQITIPKDIRKEMGITVGSRLTIVCDNGKVYLTTNPFVFAIDKLSEKMKDTPKMTEKEINEMVYQVRKEIEGK